MKKIFISYSHSNSDEVDKIERFLIDNFKVEVLRDIRKVSPLESLEEFMQKIRISDKVITILSDEYLKSEYCMYEVTELIKNDTLREPFLNKVIPIILSSNDHPFRIYDFSVQNEYIEHWLKEIIKVEKQLKENEESKANSNYGIAYDKLINRNTNRIKKLIGINESLDQFIQGVCGELYLHYSKIIESDFQLLFDVLKDEFPHELNLKPKIVYSREELVEIVNRIKPASYSDPNNPEFPLDNPSFPATKTFSIEINRKQVFIKDESTNPTGTHKDRMAWEIMIYYRRILQSLINTQDEMVQIPQLSLISSGSSAIAVQNLLNRFNLSKLKVLIKDGFPSSVYEMLQKIGCEIYKKDISIKELERNDVLRLTNNIKGIDISFRDAIDPANIEYYDWMSYEILNENPNVVIIPFGSGELFTNILNVNRNECLLGKNDKRFTGKIEILKDCKFYGVTTTNKDSKYYKLCSYFFDCKQFNADQMEMYRRLNICHQNSQVFDIDDSYYRKAEEISNSHNLTTEPSSLASIALYLQLENELKDEKKVILINTGKAKLPAEI